MECDMMADYYNNLPVKEEDTTEQDAMMEIMGEQQEKPCSCARACCVGITCGACFMCGNKCAVGVCCPDETPYVEEPYMYSDYYEEPYVQNLAEVAPVFTTIVDCCQENHQEEPTICDLGLLFQSLIEGDIQQMSYSYVEPSRFNHYWAAMEQEDVYYPQEESSYCIDALFASIAESDSAPLVCYYDSFVPQNTVETDAEVNPYCVNLADLFASECERTVVEESEQDSIIAEPYYTYDLYATLIETEGCGFMSRSLCAEPAVYDLDNLIPEVEMIEATVETVENHDEIVPMQTEEAEENLVSSFVQSEGHVLAINETCVRIEEKQEYLVQMTEEPVFTQEMFSLNYEEQDKVDECDVEEEEKLNLSNDSWDALEDEYEKADNTEEPYIERLDVDEEEQCETDGFVLFTEAFKAKFEEIKAPKMFEDIKVPKIFDEQFVVVDFNDR